MTNGEKYLERAIWEVMAELFPASDDETGGLMQHRREVLAAFAEEVARPLEERLKVYEDSLLNFSEGHRVRVEQREKIKAVEAEIKNLRIKSFFGNCDNCEPVYCCGGIECGCYGMPIDFKHTEKCENDCYIKRIVEGDEKIKALVVEIAALKGDIEFLKEQVHGENR